MKKKIVVMGVGNLLLSDEGIGVHAANEIMKWDDLPENVQVYDAGTFGLLSGPMFAGADLLVLIDAVDAKGEPGEVLRFSKEDIILDRFPMKLSPHQIGIQDTLLISDLRGECPQEIIFFGVIPASYDSSIELTEAGKKALDKVLTEIRPIIYT
jgi:hydrogenase maturation protease